MSKGKAGVITAAIVIAILAIVFFVFASQNNMLLSGDYYVKVDNAHLSQNEEKGDIVHLKSSEPYIYELDAINEAGNTAKVEFGVSRELRQDALLKLEIQPVRGVVNWEEVPEDELPPKAVEVLN